MRPADSFCSALRHIVWTLFGKYNRLRHPMTMTSERGTNDGHDACGIVANEGIVKIRRPGVVTVRDSP
ncbi:hypothetical protein LMG9673_00350 [Ralstonia pseudosolanacearum]|nr:hypothetical protein LMG9673_00350 [Ralstonia pseudosolanacearum]CBJ36887.1 protein of unknown function [Ralstonia solanacearum CMR15]